MTTPTREQVVQWAERSGHRLGPAMEHELTKFATLARADLEAQLADMTKQRDDLLAAQQWQPIETAPKNGTELLVFTKELGQMVVAWHDGYWREKANFLGLKNKPTHWMPLPAAPAIANVNGRVRCT